MFNPIQILKTTGYVLEQLFCSKKLCVAVMTSSETNLNRFDEIRERKINKRNH